ncbi:M23 family metallopeptidase [Phenylobacterium sp.]|uniref:M23 family metallopeptidase n=1 Tax=Phenylobacterium sp. TaxID=1871053 RepID=UPI0025F22A5F|nr:M23 family metallopeptidase [Phenylobacterium sp.]
MTLAAHAGMRHFWVEGLLAVALTLSVVTAAFATTAIAPRAPEPAPVYAKVVAEVPPAPPPPEPDFAFGEPVAGHSVNSPFGLRRMPWESHGRLHRGVDIAAPSGTPVTAVEDGVIVRAGTSPSYGRFVEVKHDGGLTSFYAHLGRIERGAKAGATVTGGTVIGRIGSSGISTGPHLHFEMRRGDTPLNPTAFMGREFATAEQLPMQTAAYYPKKVRVAQASGGRKHRKAAGGERVMARLDVAS